jgi:RNA polymerase sigma factor (sigma-70 family)
MPASRLDALLGAAISSLRQDSRPDDELLTRFLDEADEGAFEVLVVRHAPAVRAACRGWLRCEADIDDAAQATYLVLVQRARSIRNRAALGRWLHGVAGNVARRLRQQQRNICPMPEDVPQRGSARDRDLDDALAEEVARLPEKYRLPVQLCYASGLSTAEAAQRLGWPKGTVLTRLAWARRRLQKRLARQGLAPALPAGLGVLKPPPDSGKWVRATARAATNIRAGQSPAGTGVSPRTITLTEGVARAMMWNKLKYLALAALMAVGLAGLGIGQWVAASNGPKDDQSIKDREPGSSHPAAAGKAPARADETQPPTPARRREAVIRLPLGTFVKDIDAAPYGHGRLTWTYEEDRVLGLIEGSVMGGEFELATEAEIALSSNGTVYGLITGVRLNHLRLPDGEQFAQLKPFAGLWPAFEPLVNEVLIDLPFSYQFRVQGDRLIISNYRILLAGPNPLGKLGGLAAGNGVFTPLAYFQALGTAIEGTYTTPEARDKPAPTKLPPLRKLQNQGTRKSLP